MDQTLVATNVKIPVLIVLISSVLLYVGIVHTGSAELMGISVLMLIIGLHTLFSAKKVLLTGSAIEVRSVFVPMRKQILPLHDLMRVKAGKVLGVHTMSFQASASGDERGTMQQMNDSIQQLGNLKQMSETQRQQAAKVFVNNVRTLFIRASLSFVDARDAERAVQMLQPYVETNMRGITAAKDQPVVVSNE